MISNPVKVPCLILGYNRIDSLRNLIDQLQSQGTPRIYVALDGPRNNFDSRAQEQIELMLAERARLSNSRIFLIRQPFNLGLRTAVIKGISWFFEHEEFGVILEDDLVIHPQFQDYFSMCLTNVNIRGKFMTISGNQFLGTSNFGYISMPLIWGWATWKDEWEKISQAIQNPLAMSSLKFKKLPFSAFVVSGLIRVHFGLMQSWAITFLGASIKNSWEHLTPPFSLVINRGEGINATHTLKIPAYASKFAEFASIIPELPDYVGRNVELENFLIRVHYGVKNRHILSPIKAVLEVVANHIKRA